MDAIIRHGRVIDGTGAAAVMADVAIEGGRIAAIGEIPADGSREIDATGKVVAPGFIDIHTHSDFTLPLHPRAMSMTTQGVTTQVVGNCGFSPFPVNPERPDELARYAAFLDGGLPWGRWTSAAQYLTFLDGLGMAPNIVPLVGHGSVRMAALGFASETPMAQQIGRMCEYVDEAMAAGCFGISTGLTYAPASHAQLDELVAVAAAAARSGGFYASHIRSEASQILTAVHEAIEIGRRSGAPVQISHVKIMGKHNWALIDEVLGLVDAAVAEGLDITMDQYPYAAGSTGLTVVLPRWALEGGVEAMRERLATPAVREQIADQIARQDEADIRAGLREFDPDAIVIAEAPEHLAQHIGMTITAIAEQVGRSPVDVALDLLADAGSSILTVVLGQSDDVVARVMTHPLTMIASDGWTMSPEVGGRPHPRSYGTYTRVLGRYVRDMHVLDLETAVHKMTGLPAHRLGLHDRGVLRRGAAADIVIFDPEQVIDRATFEHPHEFSVGVSDVFVNGRHVISSGIDTGVAAGRVLRRAA